METITQAKLRNRPAPVQGKGRSYHHVIEILNQYSKGAQRVLEIGCGGGQYASLFEGGYVGLDLPLINYEGIGPSVFADAQRVPLKNHSFDLIFMVAVLHIIPDVDAVLKECNRVLNAGGTLLIFDYNLAGTRRLRNIHSEKSANTMTHVWSPWGLAGRVRNAGLKSEVIWDYIRGNTSLAHRMQSLKFVRFIRFWLWQLRGDWAIVIGKKLL